LRASKSELVKIKEVEEELKKKVLSLEEALAKAENELGKSQVRIFREKELLLCVSRKYPDPYHRGNWKFWRSRALKALGKTSGTRGLNTSRGHAQ